MFGLLTLKDDAPSPEAWQQSICFQWCFTEACHLLTSRQLGFKNTSFWTQSCKSSVCFSGHFQSFHGSHEDPSKPCPGVKLFRHLLNPLALLLQNSDATFRRFHSVCIQFVRSRRSYAQTNAPKKQIITLFSLEVTRSQIPLLFSQSRLANFLSGHPTFTSLRT